MLSENEVAPLVPRISANAKTVDHGLNAVRFFPLTTLLLLPSVLFFDLYTFNIETKRFFCVYCT